MLTNFMKTIYIQTHFTDFCIIEKFIFFKSFLLDVQSSVQLRVRVQPLRSNYFFCRLDSVFSSFLRQAVVFTVNPEIQQESTDFFAGYHVQRGDLLSTSIA